MLVFNLYAILQAIIVVVILFVLQVFLNLLGFDLMLIEGTYELLYSLMIGSYLCSIMTLRGIKGRLFWLPLWFILFIASFITKYDNEYWHSPSTTFGLETLIHEFESGKYAERINDSLAFLRASEEKTNTLVNYYFLL